MGDSTLQQETLMVKTEKDKSQVCGDDDDDVGAAPLVCSWRLLMAVLSAFGMLVIITQRAGLSVAIVCMVNQTALRLNSDILTNDSGLDNTPSNDSTRHTQACSLITFGSNSTSHQDGEFLWAKEAQGHLLGSFYYGYVVSQIPAGILAERYGSKWTMTVFLTLSTVATLLSPLAAVASYKFLIFLRVAVGIGSGAIFPVFHCLWSKWAPPYERSKLAGITFSGASMGSVIAFPIAALLCQYGFAGGWPSVFYVSGMASAVWLVLWVILSSSTPSSHRMISQREKRYIVSRLKGQTSERVKKENIPVLDIAKSLPVWAIIVANFTCDWAFYTLCTNIPTYMYEVLRFDIKSNGFYSSLPYISMWASTLITPIVADKLLSTGILDTTQTRKLFNSIGMFGGAACLVGLSFLNCENSAWAVALLTIGMAVSGVAYTGFLVNHIDIAPKYAGTLIGLTNCISAMSGFIAPYVAATLTQNQTEEEWQRVFFVSAAIYVFGGIFYAVFASGRLQPWARELEPIEVEMKMLKENHL